MNRITSRIMLTLALTLTMVSGAFAMQGMDAQSAQQGMEMGKDQTGMNKMDMNKMDMKKMDMKDGKMPSFTKTVDADGYKVEFQIMSMAAMKMPAEKGKTHHIMVKFMKPDGTQLTKTEAKIKVVSPSGQEATETLKDYSGTYAAAFDMAAKGKYGIICLFKADDGKHTAKLWYPDDK